VLGVIVCEYDGAAFQASAKEISRRRMIAERWGNNTLGMRKFYRPDLQLPNVMVAGGLAIPNFLVAP